MERSRRPGGDRRRAQRGRPDRRDARRPAPGRFRAPIWWSPTTPRPTARRGGAGARGPGGQPRRRPHGKGANVTAAAEAVLGAPPTRSRRRSCSATATSAPPRRAARRWSRRSRAASATWRSPRFATGSAAASGSRSASPAGRSSAAAAIERGRRSPASGRCAPRCCARRPAVRRGLRDGDRDDDRRRPGRVPAARDRAGPRASRHRRGTSAGSSTAARQLRDFARAYLSPARQVASAVVILAIDQGTTGTTCLVFDHDGADRRARLLRVRQHFPRPGLGRARRRPRSGR